MRRPAVAAVAATLATAALVGTEPAEISTEIVARDHLGLFTRG